VHDVDGSSTEKPCDDENEAFGVLVGMAATTVAGLSAEIDYLREIAEGEEGWMLDERECTALDLIESFAESISSIWGEVMWAHPTSPNGTVGPFLRIVAGTETVALPGA
jgi:hypothetical protein